MLLKDCPVGSVVRLVSLDGCANVLPRWEGNFEVLECEDGKYVIDGGSLTRGDVATDPAYQFEIVTPAPAQHKTIYLKGKTYNLIPARTSNFIEIDGVEYYMEEQK